MDEERIVNNPEQTLLLAEECCLCHREGVVLLPYDGEYACVDCLAKERGEDGGGPGDSVVGC